jgi:hypothetical protein
MLLEKVPYALLAAVTQFNVWRRFSWLRYVPFQHSRGNIFHSVGPNTMKLLYTEPILESNDGIMAAPSELRLVPDAFADADGASLIPPGESKFSYVSRSYPVEASYALELLGVKRISDGEFLDDLSNFMSTSPNQFQCMPLSWFARLCEVIESFHLKYEDRIGFLPIIPLRDGLWTTPEKANTGSLLFPLQSESMITPRGMGIFEVHPYVMADPRCMCLLRKFKARDANIQEMCQLILKLHASEQFRPESTSRAELISHATFLWKADWALLKLKRSIWVATQTGSFCRSSQVYISSDEPYSASRVFGEYSQQFFFLHIDYTEAFSEISGSDNWKAWLRINLDVELFPRLVRHVDPEQTSFTLNDDFQFFMTNRPYLDVLQVLRLQWAYYKQWLPADKGQKNVAQLDEATERTSAGQLRNTLSVMPVSCYGGVKVQLKDSFLLRRTILEGLYTSPDELNASKESTATASGWFPLLDVPDPEHDS